MSYHNLTLKDIADFTQNAVSTVGTWKNGRVPASAETLSRLAEIFHVSETFLLRGRAESEESRRLNSSERVLLDIEELMRELVLQEPEATLKPTPSTAESCHSQARRREELEAYFHDFLLEAARYPDGLAYVWYQLRREFPQDLFRRLNEDR